MRVGFDDAFKSIELIQYPTDADWAIAKQAALVSMGRTYSKCTPPAFEWRENMLQARHSPIRLLHFTFLFRGIPSNTATHFARHVHAVPVVSSLRNDRQEVMDGDAARRDTPVDMIFSMNAEEFITIMNKRLCGKAAENTRNYAAAMKAHVIKMCPEFEKACVPMCVRCGGVCYEMKPCNLSKHWRNL